MTDSKLQEEITYKSKVTPEQANQLAQVSEFCLQVTSYGMSMVKQTLYGSEHTYCTRRNPWNHIYFPRRRFKIFSIIHLQGLSRVYVEIEYMYISVFKGYHLMAYCILYYNHFLMKLSIISVN